MKKQKLQLSRQDLQQIYHEALINLRGSKHYDANPYDYVDFDHNWIESDIMKKLAIFGKVS